jgi:alanine racemase
MNMPLSQTPEDLAGAVLAIDLGAIQRNWRLLAERSQPARCGAAIKGNAYGLGVEPVAKALWQAGCRDYFVARPKEGEELRTILPDAAIYVLDGLFPGQAEFYARNNLLPALISIEEAQEWAAFGRVYGHKLPCAIHVDTGINRLGFSMHGFKALLADSQTFHDLDVTLLMSHLACADEPLHPLNERQRATFAEARKLLPGIPGSLANSSGIFLGKDFVHDLVRPGIALYGGNPVAPKPNPMQAVALLEGAILQVRDVSANETVGYGATWAMKRAGRIAILGTGYKDGVPRSLSVAGARNDSPQVMIGGKRCPIVGRVSMDMMAVDVTDVHVKRGDRAEILGPNILIDEAAHWAGTISYELLTRLGSRYARLYASPDSEIPV